MQTFADWLEERLWLLEWGQSDLARALDVPQGNVHRWLNGTRPCVENVEAIAEVFGVDATDLQVLVGNLPDGYLDEGTAEERELRIICRGLPSSEQDALLQFVRFRRDQVRRATAK